MSEEGNFSAEGRNNFNVGEEKKGEGEGAPLPKTIDIGHQRKVVVVVDDDDEKSARCVHENMYAVLLS